MTSTNDGKDVKSNQTSAPKGKSHYIELYKSLEARLSEVSDSSERTKHLCEAWSQVHTICLLSAQSTQSHLLSWLQRHTARTILQTEWQTPKRKEDRVRLESAIDGFVAQCVEASKDREEFPWETQLVARGEWFKKVLDRPWDHPVLSVLLNPNGTPPTDDEVLKWLKEERGVTFVMRLHALVGEKCDDIAVSLAAAVMERVRSSTIVTPDVLQIDETKDKPNASPVSSFGDKLTTEAGFTSEVWELLIDIEFVLLHKRDSSRCISLAKQTPLCSAYQLVERLQSRLELSPREKRLWKYAKDVAVLIAQVVIARCMVLPRCAGVARGALYRCSKSLARALGPRLAPATAALAAPAASAKHLHTLAQAVDAHFAQNNDTKMKPFVCELYVRAITAGMNELERLKFKTEKESEARQMEKTLCQWFLQLGNVLNASDRIVCECILTAFSVHPSVQMYDKIKEAPQLPKIVEQIEPKLETQSEFGSWAGDSRSQTNFVKTSETLNMKAQQQANVLSTAIFNEGEALGLSPVLCQDIAVLLSGPRVKTLTWDMDREQLIEHCRIYMERTHGGTRALTTELKFLNLDPQQYMHLPEEEDDEDNIYYGIEKGYEHLVPIQEDDDIWDDPNDPERTESAHSLVEELIVPPRRKKKIKPLVTSSDEEKDPLSLVTENKAEKKERPHSKERSKERKKKELVDPHKIKEAKEKKDKSKHKKDKDKPDKEKKERKKKEKSLKSESLANLVGLKVAKKSNKEENTNNIVMPLLGNLMSSISDSDYDSQGKSSMTSMNSVESSDVVFDGLFSMDELKSPERPLQSDYMGLMKNNELSVSNGKVGAHYPSQTHLTDQRKSMAMELLNQPPLNRVREDVKKSIYKLIDYRRQRAAIEQTESSQLSPHSSQSNFDNAKNYLTQSNPVKVLNNTLPSPESKLQNALSRPKTIQACISPKAVAVPDIPKTYINKQQGDKLAQLKREIDNILATRKQPRISSSIQSPVIQYAKKSIDSPSESFQAKPNVCLPRPTQHQQNPIRMKDLVTVGQERFGPYEVTKPIFAQSRPSLPVHRPPITETPGEHCYKKFLAEFQRSVDFNSMTPHTTKREIKPVSRVTPVIPNVIKSDPPQRAKPMPQQKKPDNSLNTFSRLSYMHKNKQADIKNKASQASQDVNLPRQSLGTKIEDFVWEHLHRSSQDQTSTYYTPPKVSNEYCVRKSETTRRPSSHNTILKKILGHTDTKNAKTSACEWVNTQNPVKKPNPVTSKSQPKSFLSEQDQADLIKLLRQQDSFSAPASQPLKQRIHTTAAQTPTSGPADKNTVSTKPSNKVINILSNTIIKPPSKTSATNSKPNIIFKKGVKGEVVEEPKKSECKLDTKKNEADSEWQSVCAALLAHKTPSRGPNALDIALNKSSFEKAFEDSLRRKHNLVIPETNEATQLNKGNTSKVQNTVKICGKDSKNVNSKSKGKSIMKPVEQRTDTSASSNHTKDLATTKSNELKNIIQKKPINVELPKKCLNENLKKKIIYVKPTDDDPFISGIRNSDYDLIEELMDDDLRKEIGELSSDDENYSAPAANLHKSVKPSDKRLTVAYNKQLDTHPQPVKPIEVHHQTLKQVNCVRKPATKCLFENKAVQGQAKSQTTSISQKSTESCSKITAPDVAQHNPQIHGYSNANTYAGNHMSNNSHMYVTASPQPPTQNVVVIGSNIYEGYSTVQTPIHTVTNTAYVVNSVPNMTLYRPAQYVQPVINSVIIGNTVPAPLLSTVQYSSISVQTTAMNNLINPELIHHNINNEIQSSTPMSMSQHNTIYKTLAKEESRPCNISGHTMPQNSEFHPGAAPAPCNLKEPTTILSNNVPKTNSAPVQPKMTKLSDDMMTESSMLSYKQDEYKYNNIIENIALDNNFNNDSTNLEFKTITLSEHTELNENHIKQDNKISDITCNKNIERKVLSEVQEKQILTQDKQVTSEITDTKVKYQTIDYERPLKTCQDQERLNKKRMAIINRKISHYSEETPIPLTYSPLSPVIQGTANRSVIETECKTTNEDIFTTKPQMPENVESMTKDTKDNCKENKSDATPFRRILLRSSNKLQNKNASDLKQITKKLIKKTAQLEKVNAKVIDKTIIQNDEEKSVTPKRESKRLRNKVFIKKGQQKTQHKALKVKLNIGRKAPIKIKHKKVAQNIVKEIKTIDSADAIDIEAELLGSKILKIPLPEHNIDNHLIVSNKTSKDDVMAETLTEIDSDEQNQISDNDIMEFSLEPTPIPGISESLNDITLPASIDNERNEHSTNLTVHDKTKKAEFVDDKVPETLVEMQGTDVTQLSIPDTKEAVENDRDERITTTNFKLNGADTSSLLLVNQENCKKDKAGSINIEENLENQDNILNSEEITKSAELKDSAAASEDHDENNKEVNSKTSELKDRTAPSDDNDVNKIHDKIDIIHDTGDKMNSQNNTDKEKTSIDVSEINHDIKLHSPSIMSIHDDVEIIDNKEKLEGPKSKDETSTDVSEINHDIKLSSPSVMSIDDDVEIIDDTDKLDDLESNSDIINLSDIPQSYKDSIIIEPLPNQSSDDPLKKCVRVTLPTGKAFKATIRSQLEVDFERLFKDSYIKSKMLNNLKSRTRYTLNVIQTSTHDHKVVSTQIQEIVPRRAAGEVIETVNLLSDDEDESQQVFDTEFGKYKIHTIDNVSYNKHREKLKLRPVVVLDKQETRHNKRLKNNTAVANTIDLICHEKFVEVISGRDSDIIVQPVNKEAEVVESELRDVVLIDDSSDDDINSKDIADKDIYKLKENLLKDLGVDVTKSEDKTAVLKEKLLMDLGLSMATDSKENCKSKVRTKKNPKVTDSVKPITIPDIDLTEDSATVKPKILKNQKKSVKCQIIDCNRECYVKLIRCDKFVKMIEPSQEKPLEQTVEAKLYCPKPRSRSNSLSLLNDFPLLCNFGTSSTHLDRSSPVIEVFDIIASHESFVGLQPKTLEPLIQLCDDKEHNASVVSVICNADWFETKKIINVLSKTVCTVSTPLSIIDTTIQTTLFSELPSLISLSLTYLQNSDMLSALTPIGDIKVLKTLKRKSETLQSLTTPKMSKPTMIAEMNSYMCNVSDTTDSDLSNTSIITVLNDKTAPSIETTDDIRPTINDLLDDCISSVAGSVLDCKNNVCDDMDSKIQDVEYISVSSRQILHQIEKDLVDLNISYPEFKTEEGNDVTENDAMQQSIFNNPEKDAENINHIAKNDASRETILNNPYYETDSKELAINDAMKLSISKEIEHDTEDGNDAKNDTNQELISNNTELERMEINGEQHEDEQQKDVLLNTKINEYSNNHMAKNHVIQDSIAKDTNTDPIELSLERDQSENRLLEELPSEAQRNENDGNDIPKNDVVQKSISNDNETEQIEIDCEIEHPKVCLQEDLPIDTELNEIDDITPLTLSPDPIDLLSREIINDCPVDDDISPSSNSEDKTSLCESRETNEDDVKYKFGPETALDAGIEETPVNLNDTNILINTIESDMTKKHFEIEETKHKDLKPEEVSLTVLHDTTEPTNKDGIRPNLERKSIIDKDIETKDVKTKSEVINKQENSNLNSDEEIQWEMSIANADQTINQPLESNAEHIITKILKLTGKEGSEVILKGVQYEDPQVGTYYMFPLIEQTEHSDQSEVNLEITNRDEIINLIRETSDENLNEIDESTESFDIIVPTNTYSRQTESINVQRNLKRKKDMSDGKIQQKRYRKGKNIDHPKFTAASKNDTVYLKEYKRLIEYWSTIKFSYSRPFHKENIEVDDMLQKWPIGKADENMTDSVDIEGDLFTEIEEQNTTIIDPLEQTLAQEITCEYNESDYKPFNIVETNFNMGFGERSDRVIHYTKTEKNTSKLSAATLSDVKPYQPYLTSGISTDTKNIVPEQNDENFKLRHVKFMEMREKVRSFFRKTAAELVNDVVNDGKKSQDNGNFPFGLTSTEFLTHLPQEILVNVVQVGQLPVSAAAQNPVTCDPRVTHVTNISPSQCSAENSPGDDNQTTIKTEYTELTTADITLPLVQEYAHHLQQLSSINCQEPSQIQDTDSNNSGSTEIKAQIKIEVKEENLQERLEEQAYEQLTSSSDNNNIINGAYDYHEISNSTTMENASHAQTVNSAIVNTMNGQNLHNNTPVQDALNGHNFNNSIIENAMNGENLNTIIKEEIDEFGPDTTILDDALNNQQINNTTTGDALNSQQINNTSMEDRINSHINNTLPVDDATNKQGQINTTMEKPTNDQSLDNTNAEVTMNGVTMDSMNGQNTHNDTPEEVAINDPSHNISPADNSLKIQSPNNKNEEIPKNTQNLNTIVDEAINCQRDNNEVVREVTNVQSTVQDPKDSKTSSEINCEKQIDKPDQLAHAMNAAGITPSSDLINTSEADALVDIISQNAQSDVVTTTQMTANNFTKSTPITAMALQQALAQILPPPLNQTTVSDNSQPAANPPPVLHIVQGSNSQTVINKQNGTPLLHIVQNKTASNGGTSQANSFSGLSLVDTGLQQGGNQLLHIVNTGNQKNNNTGQLLKRVNLLTNIANVQGGNEQKMVQFVCKSADGKSIQLNAPHQRSMVLRLQPIDPSTIQTTPKPTESQDVNSNTGNSLNNKDSSQQDIKSRSVYEENYAKFIQNGTDKPGQEKATSLPKFNQVFGKQVYQENKNEMNSDGLTDNTDGQQTENNIHLDGINDINSPPLLLRKSPSQTSQAQTNLVQQIKQTIAPMNIQTMHGGVIYTRQIPVNIGGGQTINLITVPSTELVDDSNQKQQTDGKFIHQEGEHVIKIVPQSQSNNVSSDENNAHVSGSNETPQNPQPQPVLTQMRIKLPMLSKGPHMVSGARVVRPSFFQIQRNVIGGTNQPVYQQLVLTTAPSLGQTIRVPAQTKPAKPPESQSSPESQMSSSTLEQLREFDMVLEQVKERSTVNPGSSQTYSNRHSSADTTDSSSVVHRSKSITQTTQVMYTTENNQTVTSYVNRKSTVTSASTSSSSSSFVRSPDSSGIVESPSSSTQNNIPQASTSESTPSETPPQPKPKKKKKSSVSSSNPAMKMPPSTPKPSSQKPLEDEQTTQRILYILAEYKEQVENSPDKDKPAPRRRNNLPPNLGSSKRKKSSSGSRRRDMSPIHGEDSCRTMGSEDSSCGTLSECAECMESHSPQESPRKVVRKLSFEQEATQITTQTRTTTTTTTTTTTIPQRNVIVADGQTITVARGPAGKPATTVLMPANYLLPVSMVKSGQQIAIVTNRGPKLLVGSGEGGTGGTLLFQRLIGPGGLKPVLTRPGVRHIRLPTAALHNLQAFNFATHTTTTQPADSTASSASAPTPPDLVDTRAMSSPWPDREAQEAKPDRGSSPEGSEPWNLPSSSIADDYGYEEIVRTDNMDRTVLDAIPDRYSPDMEAQRIFDKMFDVDSKKSMYDTRCGYDIDASDTDDRPYQVVQRRDGRHHRVTHVSTTALRHKYAILEHELRLQKSLSEECEDLGVDSPSAAELFPEAELFFAPSPVHEQTIGPCYTPPPTILNQGISQPDLDDQIATDHLLTHHDQELDINLDDVGEIVTVGEDGMTTIPLDHEEFARSHPNTTFHTEPEEGEIPPFTISQSIKGRQITFHAGRGSGTVVMGPQTTVISQATVEATGVQNTVKFTDIDNMINAMPTPQQQTIPAVLVKESGLTRFDSILTDSRELHLSNTASAIVHSTGQGTQVIRRVRYDDRREPRYLVDDPDHMMEEKIDDNRDLESIPGDDNSSSERHPELFWESNSTSERSEGRRRLDFSSDSDKCCKSPFDEASTDSSFGNHTRLDSVIKAARTERSGSGSSDDHPPLRTYPPKRVHHVHHQDPERSLSGKTRAGESCLDIEGRRRASNRGVVKRGCHCCNGSSPAPPKPKKPRQKKPMTDFNNP